MLRGIATYVRGTSDQVWTLFWINTQANVAVIMVCFTAWRTFYLDTHRSEADLRRRANVQNIARGQNTPWRTWWPWKKATETVHQRQLRDAQQAQQAQNGIRWNSTDPTQNASRDTNSAGRGRGTQPERVPRAFLRTEPQIHNMEMSELQADSRDLNMGVPELRRFSRLQPGDRVLVFSARTGAMSTESFV